MEEENISMLADHPADYSGQDDIIDPDKAPEDESLFLGCLNYIEIVGTYEMRKEMFAAWAQFVGEVANPLKTAANYNKGNYAPLDQVLNEIRPKLAEHGFGLMQSPVVNGNKVTITTVLTFQNGACMVFPQLSMNAAKDDPQTLIATVTYARRAALNAIFALYGENDDDGNAASGSGKKKAAKVSELDKKKQEVVELCRQRIAEGINKDTIYNIIKENNNGNRQPNAIPDVVTCDKVIEEINKL